MNLYPLETLPGTERRRLQARARRLEKRAQTLAGAGRMDEAIACQAELTDLRPNDPTAFFRLGLMYREVRRVEPALSALRRAADLSPEYRDPREALIATLLDSGRYQEIVSEGKKLVKLAPRSIFARDVLSLAYMQLGQTDKALRVVSELIWLDPSNPDHYLKRAMLLQQQGNVKNAVGEYTRVLEMAPEGSDAVSVAADALETIDDRQLQQILLLASDDHVFHWKAMHDPAEASLERGYHLTPDGVAKLHFLLQQQAALPSNASVAPRICLYN